METVILRDKWSHEICSHGKRKSSCKDCGGSSICSHNIQKTRCKECGGSSICSHGKRKDICKYCNGSAYCSHGKFKSQCKECVGSQICSHNKRKNTCKICSPNSNAFCKSCKLFIVKKSNDYLCNYCNPTTKLREKTKEMKLKGFLEEHYPILHNKAIQISGSCYNNFPDFMIYLQDKIIIIECDENAHRSYPIDCEIIRMNNLQFSLKSNVIWIRFNPDKVKVPIKTKYTILKSYLDYYMNSDILNEIVYLFY